MSDELKTLKGAKGGSSSFKQTPDNLRSDDTFEGVLGLCIGPIKGPTNGLQSIKMNGTAVENETGELNFGDFVVNVGNGDPALYPQAVQLKLGAGATPTPVGLTLTNPTAASGDGTPGPWVVQTVSNPNAQFLDLRFIVQELYRQDSKGIYTETLTLEVNVKPSGSNTWINPVTSVPTGTYSLQGLSGADLLGFYIKTFIPQSYYNADGTWGSTGTGYTVNGKTTSPSVYELRLAVPSTGAYANTPWDVRVRLLERDHYDDGNGNIEYRTVSWDSVSAVFGGFIGNTPGWKGVAWAQFYGKASDQLTGVPQVDGEYDTKIVPVPPAAVYNPDARTYTGATWDGSWGSAFSRDPAWIINDAISDQLSGLSLIAEGSYLNKWDALEVSKYCSAQVSDGNGGTQPRFSMNIAISEQQKAEDFIRYLAGGVSALAWDNGDGEWRMKMDKPEVPVDIFTQESIIGEITYSHTDVDTRFNSITMQFLNEDNYYAQDAVHLYDDVSIAAIGQKPTTIVAVGCTNRQEALRRGMLRLRSAVNETKVATFTTNRRGRNVEMLDCILIADNDLGSSDQKTTGRLVGLSADRKTLTVRDPLYIAPGVSYAINYAYPNPNYTPDTSTQPTSDDWMKPTIVGTANITSVGGGSMTTFTIDQPLPTTVADNLSVSLIANGLVTIPKLYRVTNVAANDDGETMSISALEVDTGKYLAADTVTNAATVFVDMRGEAPAPTPVPGQSLLSLVAVPIAQGKQINLLANWIRPSSAYVSGFRIQYSVNGGVLQTAVDRQQLTDWELPNAGPGQYHVEICTITRSGQYSLPLTGDLEVTQALIDATQITYNNGVSLQDLQPNEAGADVTSNNTSADTSAVNGVPSSYITQTLVDNNTKIAQLQAATAVDTTAPAIPTGLTSDNGVIAANGTIDLTFSWNANTESDLDGYVLAVSTNGGGYVPFPATGTSYVFHGLQPGVSFSAKILALDTSNNSSGYSAVYSSTTKKDTTPPGPATGFTITPSFDSLFLNWSNPSDLDVAKANVYESTTNSLSNASVVQQVNASPSGKSGFSRTGLGTGQSRWYWIQIVDTSGNGSTLAGPVQGSTTAISQADVTPGLVLPKSSLTSLSDAGVQGQTATYNGNLYRYDNGAWTAAVATGLLTGQVQASQIAAGTIDATKLASGLTAPQVVNKSNMNDGTVVAPMGGALAYNTYDGQLYRNADSTHLATGWSSLVTNAAALSGQITGTQITNGAISTPQLAANAVTAANIAANTITAGQIASNTITAGQIATATITSTQIAANTITAANILSGTITTAQIAANTITANNIASQTITANQIATGTLTAAQIAAGAITASKIGVLGNSLFPDGQIQDQSWWTSLGQAVPPGANGTNGAVNPAWVYQSSGDAAGNMGRVGCTQAYILYDGVYTGTGTLLQVLSPVMQGVVQGQYYEVGSTLYNGGGAKQSNRNLYFCIEWFKPDGTLIGSPTILGQANANAGMVTISTQVQAPSGAALYRLYWEADGTGAFQGLISFGSVFFRQAAGGTFIIDGSLAATKITAGTITSTQIAAGTITGDRINSTTSLPASLTVGNTGFSLSVLQQGTASGSNGANLVPYSDFNGGQTGYYIGYNPGGLSVGTNTGNNAGKNFYTWAWTAPDTTANSQVSIITNKFGVTGGSYVYIGSYQQGTNVTISLSYRFRDINGNVLSAGSVPTWTSGYGYFPSAGSTQSWEQCRLGSFVTVPSNAATCELEHYALPVAKGACYAYFAAPMVITCAVGQTIPPSYVPGPVPDGAAAINGYTTQINPGQILISGGTSLANWRNGSDLTKIEGGSIAANTITANKLTIGNRGASFPGLSFQVINNYTAVTWPTCYAVYTDNNGSSQQVLVSGATQTLNNGSYYYFYWTQGAGAINSTTDSTIQTNPNAIVVAMWSCGSPLIIVNYGGTIVDGANITTGSIKAAQIAAGTITGDRLSAGTITATQIAANSITGDRIAANTITAANITVGDATNMLLNGDFSTGNLSGWCRVVTQNGGSVTVVPGSNWPAYYALLMQQGGTGGGELSITAGNVNFDGDTNMVGGFNCAYGEQFFFTCTTYAYGGTIPQIELIQRWNNGSPQIGSVSSFVGTSGQFVTTSGTLTASYNGKGYLRLTCSNNGAANSGMYWWSCKLFRVINGANLIATGSIIGNNISANTIVTNHLVDNSVTASLGVYITSSFAGQGTPAGSNLQNGTVGDGSGNTASGGGVRTCIDVASFMPHGGVADEVKAGSPLYLLNRDNDNGYHEEACENVRSGWEVCYRIKTTGGGSLVCSSSTPITSRVGKTHKLISSLGVEIPVLRKKVFGWEKIDSIEYVGLREVKMISAGNGVYAASENDNDYYLFTHNNTVKQ